MPSSSLVKTILLYKARVLLAEASDRTGVQIPVPEVSLDELDEHDLDWLCKELHEIVYAPPKRR